MMVSMVSTCPPALFGGKTNSHYLWVRRVSGTRQAYCRCFVCWYSLGKKDIINQTPFRKHRLALTNQHSHWPLPHIQLVPSYWWQKSKLKGPSPQRVCSNRIKKSAKQILICVFLSGAFSCCFILWFQPNTIQTHADWCQMNSKKKEKKKGSLIVRQDTNVLIAPNGSTKCWPILALDEEGGNGRKIEISFRQTEHNRPSNNLSFSPWCWRQRHFHFWAFHFSISLFFASCGVSQDFIVRTSSPCTILNGV